MTLSMTMLVSMELDYTLRVVAGGAALVGATCGGLGAFAVLRGQSLVGDAVAHAALPGVALAFLLTGSRDPLALALGAAVTGGLAVRFATRVSESGVVRRDSALAISLAAFFGLGLALLTYVQRLPDAPQAGLDRYLFGQAATLVAADLVRIGAVALAALAVVVVAWRPLSVLAFDRSFGEAVGLPMRAAEALLTALLVGAIVVGLDAVGVVLVSALVVAPGVAARQWTNRLAPLIALAAAFGAVSGAVGAAIRATSGKLPTGPVIVLVACTLAGLSLLAGRLREQRASRVRRVAIEAEAPGGPFAAGVSLPVPVPSAPAEGAP